MVVGNPVAAADEYRLAIDGIEILTKALPDNPTFAQDQAIADYRMGVACQRAAILPPGVASAGWTAASRFHLDRARQTLQKLAQLAPDDTIVQGRLLVAEARCGMRAEAIHRADALLKQFPDDPRTLFHTACGYALAGEANDRALATLEQAAANGWKDVFALQHDPDLDPIRTEPRLLALQRKLLITQPKK